MSAFRMKGYTAELLNTYDCEDCKAKGIEHEVINVAGPTTTRSSTWGSGLPTTMRQCTNCGFKDGPWVSADIVGGGW